ncbi:MAG: hypothetical protein Q4B50_01965, partial [Bacillota bacterium]|nr:hypothetical protein [Bacillota bacterium]
MKKCIAVLLFSALLLCFSACMAASVPGEEGSPQMEDKSPAAEEELAFSLGRVEGNTYENEFLGIGCTLDSSWTFFSQEELSALNNAAEDMLPADFTESAAEAEQLYAMYALGENQMDVISINLEKADNEIIEKLDLRKNYEKAAALLMDGYEQLGY